MSQINVNRIKDSNEGAPDFPSGVNVSGITSTVTLGVTNLTTTNLNVSGVVTATTLDGNLLATGTPTLGLGVTINTSGLNISGVATAGIVSATTLYGDGSNLTGIALSIAPLNYNPAYLGADLSTSTGIGLTFNQAVKAGSGEVTLRIAGAAGTVVQTWGVGSSITYSKGDEISMSLVSNLSNSEVYHLSYPSGAFTNTGGDVSYVGTAYTFSAKPLQYQWWAMGRNDQGQLGQGNNTDYSSPVQIPGLTWSDILAGSQSGHAIRSNGTLWGFGRNYHGEVGNNSRSDYNSPVQVGSDTTWAELGGNMTVTTCATKTDGTLWVWGSYDTGVLGLGDNTMRSSPTQIPGTTWTSNVGKKLTLTAASAGAIKTDGTLWVWGAGDVGQLAQNNRTSYSSPKQVPGTTWATISPGDTYAGVKTDGTLWMWGRNLYGQLGQNSLGHRSSPVQIPGTSWSHALNTTYTSLGLRSDGTLWGWGGQDYGQLGQNEHNARYSSPVQLPGSWSKIGKCGTNGYAGLKTDGTLWSWGYNNYGNVGDNSTTQRSSPTQVPGTWAIGKITSSSNNMHVLKEV